MRNGISEANVTGGAPGWEPLLKRYGVDMYLSAHVHSYERFLPVYNGSSDDKWRSTPNRIVNPGVPVHVVSGAAGDVEDQEGFKAPFASGSTFRTMDYGYNRMLVHNATHLEWLFITTSSSATDEVAAARGNVTDRMWLVKSA